MDADPVFDRATGVEELELGEDRVRNRLGHTAERNDGRGPDQAENRVGGPPRKGSHGRRIKGCPYTLGGGSSFDSNRTVKAARPSAFSRRWARCSAPWNRR